MESVASRKRRSSQLLLLLRRSTAAWNFDVDRLSLLSCFMNITLAPVAALHAPTAVASSPVAAAAAAV